MVTLRFVGTKNIRLKGPVLKVLTKDRIRCRILPSYMILLYIQLSNYLMHADSKEQQLLLPAEGSICKQVWR